MNKSKIDIILQTWKEDSVIDDVDVDKTSANIPLLHGKYVQELSLNRRKLKALQLKRRQLYSELRKYYLGRCDDIDLSKLKRDQFLVKILNSEVDTYINADKEMIELDSLIAITDDTVDVLTEIMKSINSRNYTISNIINHRKLILGG